MKKMMAILTAMALLGSAASCNKGKVEDVPKDEQPTSQAEVLAAEMSLKSANILMAEDFSDIISTDMKSVNVLIFGRLKSGGYGG